MFQKEEEKFGKTYDLDRPPKGTVEHLMDLKLGDLFIFAGGREVLRLGEDGDDMCGGFLTATRILTDETIWTSYDYEGDCSGMPEIGVETGFHIADESPRIVRIKEMNARSSAVRAPG